jgi:hypothetical protein
MLLLFGEIDQLSNLDQNPLANFGCAIKNGVEKNLPKKIMFSIVEY